MISCDYFLAKTRAALSLRRLMKKIMRKLVEHHITKHVGLEFRVKENEMLALKLRINAGSDRFAHNDGYTFLFAETVEVGSCRWSFSDPRKRCTKSRHNDLVEPRFVFKICCYFAISLLKNLLC